jgi:hypothetical protein
MTHFNLDNWQTEKWKYLVILIIIIVIVIYISEHQNTELRGKGHRKKGDGNGDAIYLGRGHPKENVSEILDRIEWSTYLERRVTHWHRIFLMALVISFLVILFIIKALPTAASFVLLFIIVFIPIMATRQLFYVHADIYNDYYIKHNVEILRKKFGYDKSDPKEPTADFPDRPKVM